jgi:DNA-binding MarR family transcriptional regulator
MKLKKKLKLKEFRNDWEKLLLNFQLCQNDLQAHLKECLKPHKLTFQQYNVLRIIDQAKKDNVTNLYIKERLVERDADVSRLVVRMAQAGLLNKLIDITDKRKSKISISDEGLAKFEAVNKDIQNVDRFFYNLGKKEAKTLNSLLDKLRGSS